MKLTNELKEFFTKYSEYEKTVLEPTLNEIKNGLWEIERPGYWSKYMTGNGVATPSPIKLIMTRIKHPEKVVEKIFRKSESFPNKLSFDSIVRMHDKIGIRVIVYFSSQLSLIDRELRNSTVFELDENTPPEAFFTPEKLRRLGLSHVVSKHKDSGYSSIHYMARLRDSSIPINERPVFEIQVRTLAQELWCELEHVLSYKPETRPHFSAKRRFQILSDEVSVIDEHFNLLYEELIYNQEIIKYKDSDTLTFENAPKVFSEINIQCALTELNPILKTLFSNGIITVGDFIKIATPLRVTTIRNNFVSITGKLPDNIELITILSILNKSESKEAEIERIKTHITLQKVIDKNQT